MSAKPGPLRPHEERRSYFRVPPPATLPGTPELGDTFLIVTEGEVTEREYFESLRCLLQFDPVTVKVVHPNCTDAMGLIKAAINERSQPREKRRRGEAGNRDVSNYDHTWVVFDTDVPERLGTLGNALNAARKESVHVALSTPTIELWLLLHFRDRPGPLLDSSAAERALSDCLGYSYDKSKATFRRLWPILRPNIEMAVRRATEVRSFHQRANSLFPPNPSTDVDRLVCALNASIQPNLRILK
jgi:hypothetical protein